MKTLSKILVVALTITSVSFIGCKKGEGDPFLSLSSRKARVAGEWKVTKGEGTYTEVLSSQTFTTTLSYDGTTETQTTNPGNFTQTSKYTDEYTFEKDGSFTMVHTDNDASPAQVTTSSGKWNFTGGVGEMKSKSQLVLYIESQTMGSSTTTWTGSDRPTVVFDIYQLKGKEMILHEKGTTSTGTQTSDVKWTMEPK